MEIYLLFDSACSKCSRIAQEIEQIVQGRLEIRSLHDGAMQKLLDQAKPGWKWEPTLLEVDGAKVRVYTGFGLRARLVMRVGPRRAFHVAGVVQRHRRAGNDLAAANPTRRHLLQQVGTLFPLAALLPNGLNSTLWREQGVEQGQVSGEGEFWEGFYLLPTIDAPWPAFVECAPAPVLCQVVGDQDVPHRGETVMRDRVEATQESVPFRLYRPQSLPHDMKFKQGQVILFAQSGDPFTATLVYGGAGRAQVQIRARQSYPRPYPVYPVHSPSAEKEETVYPEKIDFLPAPGIRRPSVGGHVFDWIEQDVLYTLIVEGIPDDAVRALVRSLVKM